MENYYARSRTTQKNNTNDHRNKSTSKGKGRSYSIGPKENLNCHHCGKHGYFSKQCHSWLRKNKDKNGNKNSGRESQESDNLGQGSDNGEVLVSTMSKITSGWILYSGCTYHISCKRDWLSDFHELEGGKVIIGNNQTCQVRGTNIKISDGVVRTLKDVRYVFGFTRNMISLGVLDDSGYYNKIERGTMKICRGAMVVIKRIKESGIYHLVGETLVENISIASTP